jgi:BirA family biotin operon repressor/biotin-[acetyl-CoA-carboxylase] ligase
MIPGITLTTGVAIADALASAGIAAQLKWPNDVLIDGAKLAGILAEVATAPDGADIVILGFGINLSVDTFPTGADGASLHRLVAGPVPSWDIVLADVLAALARWLQRLRDAGLDPVLSAWRARAVGIGSMVAAETPAGRIAGVATGIDGDGALLVATAGGTIRLLAGDVHIGLTPPAT